MDSGVSFRILAAGSGDPEVINGRRDFGCLRRFFWTDFLGTERAINGCEQDGLDSCADAFGAFNGHLLVGARLLESKKLAGPLPIQEYLPTVVLPDDAVEVSRLVARQGNRCQETMTAFLVWLAMIAASRGSGVYMNINRKALCAIGKRAEACGYPGLLEELPGRQMEITARTGEVVFFHPVKLNPEVLNPRWVDALLQNLLPPNIES